MVLYWKLKIFKRPSWNSELLIKTWGREFSKISSWRDYEIYDKKQKKVGSATSEWVLIDTKKQGIGRITEDLMQSYGLVQENVFSEKLSGKLKEPENMKKIYEYTSKRRDIDINHHVNNVNYLEFAYDALPDGLNINFNNVEIYYKKQVKLRRDNKLILFKRK